MRMNEAQACRPDHGQTENPHEYELPMLAVPDGDEDRDVVNFRAPATFGNCEDHEGNPTGGFVLAKGIQIRWQNGPMPRISMHNGAFICTVIAAVIQRLEFFQRGRFACDENAEALRHLREAKRILGERRRRRAEAGVLGTSKGA